MRQVAWDALRRILHEFEQKGATDELTIVEALAHMLTRDKPLAPGERPELPWDIEVDLPRVSHLLEEAVADPDIGNAAKLFNEMILFLLSDAGAGQRFPTPRHVVALMQRLACVKADQLVADLACGSAGLLVPAGQEWRPRKVYGCDISPAWVRLANANCALHEIPAEIHAGNALQLFSRYGTLGDIRFDRILLSPPFGLRADPAQVESAFGGEPVGTRSETVLSHLALSRLKPGGRAVMLTHDGVLHGSTGAERALRERLVRGHQLRAVVALPKDAMQPFQAVRTSILVVDDSIGDESAPTTWFLEARTDGYPPGRSRNLSRPPVLTSDLPVIGEVLAPAGSSAERAVELREGASVTYRLLGDDSDPLGLVITVGSGSIVAIEPCLEDDMLLLRIRQGRTEVVAVADLGSGTVTPESSSAALGRYSYGSGRRASGHPLKLQRVFETAAQAVAITRDGRILGVAIPEAELRQADFDLRIERYIPRLLEREEFVRLEQPDSPSPVAILSELAVGHAQLRSRIDALIQRVQTQPLAVEETPLPPWPRPNLLRPIGRLSAHQQAVWERILGDNDFMPRPFTASDVDPDPIRVRRREASPETWAALDLFEKMGLILRASVNVDDQAIAYYRLISAREHCGPEDTGNPEVTGP